ncbi:MAG: hypothetical protein JKY22_05055 [Flavobacteriaceae bacterium]|nr:hypothetical protein [Flavobacteriaceae bacterium]
MSTTNKPNKWFWIIAVLALLWNLIGVSRYVMEAYSVESFRAQFNTDQLALMDASPAWLTAVFAIAVFSGFLACLVFLLKRKFAVLLFGVSLLAVLIQMISVWTTTNTIEVFGTMDGVVMPMIVITISIFLYYYSKGASQKGWLR